MRDISEGVSFMFRSYFLFFASLAHVRISHRLIFCCCQMTRFVNFTDAFTTCVVLAVRVVNIRKTCV